MVLAILHALPPLPTDGEQAVFRIPTGSGYVVGAPSPLTRAAERPYDLSQSIPPSMWKEWRDAQNGNSRAGNSNGAWLVDAVLNSSHDRVMGDGSKLMVRDTSKSLWLRWLVHKPNGYGGGGNWPLVIHLHGLGERGFDLNELRNRGPFARKVADLPFLVVAPQCPSGQTWQTADLQVLVREALSRYRVDTRRVFVSGHGMGATAAWQLAGAEPRRFGAIVAPGVEPLPQDRSRLRRVRRYEGTEADPWLEDDVVEFLQR